jgi:hypothetical protein
VPDEEEAVTLFWLSYADDNGFRGAIIIDAESDLDAVARTHRLGISPGGQVMMVRVPVETMSLESRRKHETHVERLLSLADLQELSFSPMRVSDA